MKLAAGDAIGGYRVLRQLGAGGMGAIYEVEHVNLGVRYALKAFTREHGDVESLRRRFWVEGMALARLRHPNLLRVYDFGEDAERGVLYFVMDLVVGSDGAARTLADVEPGEVDERQLAKWYGELRSALEYIHSRGIVHRDFKPGNVLIDAQGNAILGDFGISRFVDGELREELGITTTVEVEKAEARTIMGSVMFLAPEVRRGENATPASDAYALGVTFYRLLTGIWYEPGPVADGFLAEFGDEWSNALRQLLSDDPAVRLPIPSVETGGVPSKKRRRIVAICVVVAVLIVAVSIVVGTAPRAVSESEPSTPVGTAPRAVRDLGASTPVGTRVPRDCGHVGTALPEYTFDQFFPLHKED
ncbi:MAG: serine/threonine protein kinase [Kiritimatiellae bacterium]|nr:serine/threonine protein kinase [Kiritimatiellia bacterium]